jgi:hypothetical protein
MKHKPLAELTNIADVLPAKPVMSRRERLERWAECLEREPQRQLKSLEEIEWAPRAERYATRADNSPLAVAFADPVLREEGLSSDRLGDALTFFELTEGEAHRVLCSCLHGRTMQAGEAARRVRSVAATPSLRVWPAALSLAGLIAGLPVLVHLLR